VAEESEFEELVKKLAIAMQTKKWRLVVAESCTGGWISKVCTDLPGSSAWFDRGFISYSYPAKVDMLHVDSSLLEQQGAVSEAVACQMVHGARQQAGVEVAVAVTGIAGPEGGTADKPVGTVWFAWSIAGQTDNSECLVFTGDRESVRRQTVIHALSGLLQRL